MNLHQRREMLDALSHIREGTQELHQFIGGAQVYRFDAQSRQLIGICLSVTKCLACFSWSKRSYRCWLGDCEIEAPKEKKP